MNRIEVRLTYLFDLGLIIKGVSDIIYSNKSCGQLNIIKKSEGSLALLEGDHCEMIKRLNNFFHNNYPNGINGLTTGDADEIDFILKNYPKKPEYTLPTEIISIDRDMLHDSGEKWIHVIIEDQPERPIHNYREQKDLYEGGYYSEENNVLVWKKFYWDKKNYPSVTKDPRFYEFYGFGQSKGILTWSNG